TIETHLTNQYEVGSLFSPLQVLKLANKTMHGDDHFAIPDSQKEVDRLVRLVRRMDKDSMIQLFVNEEMHMARVQGKVGDLGAREFEQRNEKLMSVYGDLENPKFDIRVTGTATLIDLNNAYLATDMTIGLIIAFLVVAIIMGLMFKSVKMVLICLIPNILPLLMIAGIMGALGIDLKVSTSIIFTIAFGIAVDDTIHFMSKLRLELGKGKSLLYALKRTYISTGKAIIITSIILSGGFFTLVFSSFLGTFYVGLLISLTLLFAVLADLTLLPVLILLFFRKK
ncbi:MAG: MMPL family transporter, partial [Flavobacteriales bacterium]|nr:MMPL family transporter [Flavobacteriales bacterium]